MTYSKHELKKMFLRVLYECLYGKMKDHSHSIDSIVPSWMNEYFNIKMTKEEIQLTYEAIQELKNSGVIVRNSTQYSDVFQVLTAKGKEIVEKQKDPDVHGLKLEEVVKDTNLLSRCSDAFNDGRYEEAIFSAYKLVEETVRYKAGLSDADIGVNLMSKALNPNTGKLTIPSCKLPAEQDGVHSLFRGSIAFFKNPSSHRTVNYEDRLTGIKIIAFAELLLNIISTAQPSTRP